MHVPLVRFKNVKRMGLFLFGGFVGAFAPALIAILLDQSGMLNASKDSAYFRYGADALLVMSLVYGFLLYSLGLFITSRPIPEPPLRASAFAGALYTAGVFSIAIFAPVSNNALIAAWFVCGPLLAASWCAKLFVPNPTMPKSFREVGGTPDHQ